jgi:hypothetical protein
MYIDMSNNNFDELVKKINQLKASGTFDLSLEEDLSIAIMNLVSLEEHFFFTAKKTGKDEYYSFLQEAREIRKDLLGRMISKHEGETWCISKHLLAASMRVLEVGTKLQSSGKIDEAKKMFDYSYKLYGMFWGIRLKLIDLSGVNNIGDNQLNNKDKGTGKPWTMEDIVNKLVDCCKE